jgi:hypothetical protein
MATGTAPVTNNKQAKAGRKIAQGPPAGAFWKKYSPHHEFPLSLSSSIFSHFLGFVILSGFLLAFFGLVRDKELPVDTVVVAGGGGNPNGIGNNRGDGVLPSSEAVEGKDKPQPDKVAENLNKEQLNKPEVKKPELPPLNPSGVRPIETDTSAADTKLGAIGDKLRTKIAGAIAGKGQGGPGSGGGLGSGTGTGIGNASGAGRGNLTQREKRQLRWTMMFNTRSGEDYADQLLGLGAILAIPAGPDHEYLVIREFDRRHRPVQPRREDLKDLNRIYWVDDKPQSVYSLAMALGIRPVPEHIVAFFPPELEKELADKEQKAFGGKEEDIAETVFKVEPRGNHRYEPVVVSQKRR